MIKRVADLEGLIHLHPDTNSRKEENPIVSGVGIELLQADEDAEGYEDTQALHADDSFLKTDEFALEDTIWDAALLLTDPRMGILGRVFGVGMVVVNSIIQLVITLVVAQSLTQSEFDSGSIAG